MNMPLDFSTMVSSAQRGDILTPVLHRMLYDPKFVGFDAPVKAWQKREYDGKFHPSSHSLWTVRQLYLYLTRPELLTEERMELTSVLAVTAGAFWHEFLQNLWMKDGIMIRQRPLRVYDINPAEVVAKDPETNRTGHADGELTNGEMVEIKTINDFQIHKITNELILKEKKLAYWAQTQDYLDILGRDAMRYFFLAPSYPYPMGEFVVKADKAYQAQRRDEYRRAMDLAERYPDGNAVDLTDPVVVSACCAPGSKVAQACLVRLACPIGRYSK